MKIISNLYDSLITSVFKKFTMCSAALFVHTLNYLKDVIFNGLMHYDFDGSDH
jgi:hypothetical protein